MDMCDTCAVKYWGSIENRPIKKNSWYAADARMSTLELRNKADVQPSTLVQLHRIYLLRVQDADFFTKVQFSCEAFCFLEGINNESFLSCNEPILVPEPALRGLPTLCASSAVLSEASVLACKAASFSLSCWCFIYNIGFQRKEGDQWGQVWLVLRGGCLRLPELKALCLICASSPLVSP